MESIEDSYQSNPSPSNPYHHKYIKGLIAQEKTALLQKLQKEWEHMTLGFGEDLPLLKRRTFWINDEGKQACSSRAYFIVKIFQVITGTTSFSRALKNSFLFNIILLGEIVITLFYLENHINDRKNNIVNPENFEKNKKEAARLKKLSKKIIEENFSRRQKGIINKKLKKLFSLYRTGIQLDLTQLSVDNFEYGEKAFLQLDKKTKKFVNVDFFIKIIKSKVEHYIHLGKKENDYLKLYLTRSFLINGVFFQCFAELIIELFGNNSGKDLKVIEYARTFGLLQQLVNDNCDFIPNHLVPSNSCKLQEDTFSDARRKLITLPSMYFLKMSKDSTCWLSRHFRNKKDSTYKLIRTKYQVEALEKMKESGALGAAMSTVFQLRKHILSLTISSEDDTDAILKELSFIAEANKYYRICNLFNQEEDVKELRLSYSKEKYVVNAVRDFAMEYPSYGKIKAANELIRRGYFISPDQIQHIWNKYGLQNKKVRQKFLNEKKPLIPDLSTTPFNTIPLAA